jgi:hypothetical protein
VFLKRRILTVKIGSREISLGCLGMAVVLAFIVVFGTEGIFALLRRRDVTANITIVDANTKTATPGPTPSGPAPVTAVVMLADGTVMIHIDWNYHIGPRFPTTNIQTDVKDKDGVIVASDTFTIDCGNATLDCTGSTDRAIHAPKNTWPSGDYNVNVAYIYVGVTVTHPLAAQLIHVD